MSVIPPALEALLSLVKNDEASINVVIKQVGSPVAATQHGLVWSTAVNPDISTAPATMKSELGIPTLQSFTSTIKSLQPNTDYHVRAYMIHVNGTVYSNDVAFKTLLVPAIVAPPPIVTPTPPQLTYYYVPTTYTRRRDRRPVQIPQRVVDYMPTVGDMSSLMMYGQGQALRQLDFIDRETPGFMTCLVEINGLVSERTVRIARIPSTKQAFGLRVDTFEDEKVFVPSMTNPSRFEWGMQSLGFVGSCFSKKDNTVLRLSNV
jgi:hypothetical protein